MSDLSNLRERLLAHAEPCDVQGLLTDARTIPLSYSRHTPGIHPVRPDLEPVAFESKLEGRAISLLANFRELIELRSQPITLVYRSRGSLLRYTPDFWVRLSQVPSELEDLGFARETFVEIKPWRRAVAQESLLARKFSALRQATGKPVVLLTDMDIPPHMGGFHGH